MKYVTEFLRVDLRELESVDLKLTLFHTVEDDRYSEGPNMINFFALGGRRCYDLLMLLIQCALFRSL